MSKQKRGGQRKTENDALNYHPNSVVASLDDEQKVRYREWLRQVHIDAEEMEDWYREEIKT